MHYSVSEGSGHVEVVILNKTGEVGKVGVRTIDGEAKASDNDYVPLNETLEFEKGVESKIIKIKILDDDNWEPDEDFYVELYDTVTEMKLEGEDTRCTITILDDDKPGVLSLEKRSVKAIAADEKVVVKVLR